MLWLPEKPHEVGLIRDAKTKLVISEVPSRTAVYDALVLPKPIHRDMDIELQRRHAQIQLALVLVGNAARFRSWVAVNDRAIEYRGRRLGEMDGVVADLASEPLFRAYGEAAEAGKYIDCIWLHEDRFMPAAFEIEHSTGVTSGLTRMQKLADKIPPIPTRWVVVAPDEDREKVYHETALPQFRKLNARFMPYSSVEELYSMAQHNRLRGVTEEFFDGFMEEPSGV